MSTNVFSIGSEATVKEAVSKMAQQEIGSLVVIEQSRPIGIVTERDLLSRVLALGRKGDVSTSQDDHVEAPDLWRTRHGCQRGREIHDP